MDEKKSIKVSLGTVICFFIIVILIIIIAVMYFHYNFGVNQNELFNNNQSNIVTNTNDNSNEMLNENINIDDPIGDESVEAQEFVGPEYYMLNGEEGNPTVFVWRKLCEY